MGRWKECFAELINVENERKQRVKAASVVEAAKMSKDEVGRALKRMKSGKGSGF